MKKDIFIDNNIAKNFCNPMDPNYKALIKWLIHFNPEDKDVEKYAHIVLSNALIGEYSRTCGSSMSTTNINYIVAQMTKEGRIVRFSNIQIKEFRQNYFTKSVVRKLRSNATDRDHHIPAVLLSNRKYAVVIDGALSSDLSYFPGFCVFVSSRPEDIPYAT